MRVWKYPIEVNDWFELSLPLAAKVVAVGLDPATSEPAMWVEVDEAAPRELRRFRLAGTGHRIEPGLKFLGSVIGHLGGLVWHLYEPEWEILRDADGNLIDVFQLRVGPSEPFNSGVDGE